MNKPFFIDRKIWEAKYVQKCAATLLYTLSVLCTLLAKEVYGIKEVIINILQGAATEVHKFQAILLEKEKNKYYIREKMKKRPPKFFRRSPGKGSNIYGTQN